MFFHKIPILLTGYFLFSVFIFLLPRKEQSAHLIHIFFFVYKNKHDKEQCRSASHINICHIKDWEIDQFKIEKIYYCPHHPEGSVPEYTGVCDCRKPKPGMLLQALADYDIDKEQSFLVGDSKRDVEAAEAAGVKGYLYTGGNLLDFVKNIVSER